MKVKYIRIFFMSFVYYVNVYKYMNLLVTPLSIYIDYIYSMVTRILHSYYIIMVYNNY